MAFLGSDVVMISRAGTHYKTLGTDILTFVQANIGTSEYTVADIAARNALGGMSIGDRVMVNDATGDATVGTGWAIYVWMAANTWRKVAEQEGLDVVVGGTDLSIVVGAAAIQINSSSGNDITVPLATAALAGLMSPAQFEKLAFVTVTAATNLDTIRNASHAAVTLGGTANSNPITLAGQQLGFSIDNLTAAP
jgi:hypothetical protein